MVEGGLAHAASARPIAAVCPALRPVFSPLFPPRLPVRLPWRAGLMEAAAGQQDAGLQPGHKGECWDQGDGPEQGPPGFQGWLSNLHCAEHSSCSGALTVVGAIAGASAGYQALLLRGAIVALNPVDPHPALPPSARSSQRAPTWQGPPSCGASPSTTATTRCAPS